MKQILVLSVIIFISIQTVYAEYANKYGIKYRFAANQNNRFLKGLKNEKYDDEEAIDIEGDNRKNNLSNNNCFQRNFVW